MARVWLKGCGLDMLGKGVLFIGGLVKGVCPWVKWCGLVAVLSKGVVDALAAL